MDKVVVSIIMLTYNHERYVRQAIDSILMQRVNFKYEIIIGDDCSGDKTQEILKEYREKHPDIITLILREQNIGATNNGYDVKRRTKGKYLAALDGDDYWTDEFKLQKQVDFLEKHPEFIACTHKCIYVDKYGEPIKGIEKNYGYCEKEEYTISDYEKGIMAGQAGTILYRNIYLDHSIDCSIIYKASNIVGDWTTTLLLITHGRIYCMSEIMSHYRQVTDKDSSSWSAIQANGNVRYEYYCTQLRLEQYGREVLKKEIDFTRRKKDIYLSAVFKMLRQPSKENLSIVVKIIKASKQPIYYTWFGIYILLKKIVYKVVYRDDRRVEYK